MVSIDSQRLTRVLIVLYRTYMPKPGLFQPQRLAAGPGADFQRNKFTHGNLLTDPIDVPVRRRGCIVDLSSETHPSSRTCVPSIGPASP